MLATGERPRELRWYHAGPMLFGDWGTSRLYVLGLAFAFTARASFWFIAAMCVLMIGVGLCYEIICRLFPDGGGVYSSARTRSQLLAVIGGLLLCADYVVTASLSCLDAFHYLGFQNMSCLDALHRCGVSPDVLTRLGLAVFLQPLSADAFLATATILFVGFLNYFGPTKTGTLAMLVALATVALTLVIGVASLPHLASAHLESPFSGGTSQMWVGFTEMILALSGVEAIANMTGIMVPPVERTARWAIRPVLIEIVILNLILSAAMNSLPDTILYDANHNPAHTGDMLKVIATQYIGPVFAGASSVVFAALLLSAVNTALAGVVSIQFMLSRDKELPHAFAGLNRFGMPVLPLLIGAIVPAVVVLIFPNVEDLSGLYAIGVVGAISINLGTASTNPELSLKRWERALMFGLTLLMVAVFITICVVKPHARGFALVVLVTGLAGRLATIVSNRAVPIARTTRNLYLAIASLSVIAEVSVAISPIRDSMLALALSLGVAFIVGFASYRTQRYRLILMGAPVTLVPAPPKLKLIEPGSYTPKVRVMVPTQGNPRLIDFAIQECKLRQGELQLLFIRHLAFTPMGPSTVPTLAEDNQAQELFERVRKQAHEAGVPLRLLYGVARDIPDAILDMAVTHGADLLLLGTTRRGALWKAMKGDVIQTVAEQLPERVGLLIHA
jgi:amino acid transporter